MTGVLHHAGVDVCKPDGLEPLHSALQAGRKVRLARPGGVAAAVMIHSIASNQRLTRAVLQAVNQAANKNRGLPEPLHQPGGAPVPLWYRVSQACSQQLHHKPSGN